MDISFDELKSIVAEPYLSRGLQYYKDGVIEISSNKKTSMKARVVGSSVYFVNFSRVANNLKTSCSCLAFTDYGPCKHIAAAGYALLNIEKYQPSQENQEQLEFYGKVRKELSSMTKTELIDWIFCVSYNNPDILSEFEIYE